MNYPKLLAGTFAGAGALLLIHNGYVEYGVMILTTMLGFFVGEANGKRIANKEQ